MSVLSIQTRRIDGLTEATTAEDEDLLLIRKADGTGTRNIKKKNLIPKIVDKVGDLNELTTADKTSVVKAVNEIRNKVDVREYDNANRFTRVESVANNANELVRYVVQDNAASHNNIYRGKNLGRSLTNIQLQGIKDGTFKDLYIGDYFDFGSKTLYVAHLDYFFWRTKHSFELNAPLSKHHLVLIPNCSFLFYTYDTQRRSYAFSDLKKALETDIIMSAVRSIPNVEALDVLDLQDYRSLTDNVAKRQYYKCCAGVPSSCMVIGRDLSANSTSGLFPTDPQIALFRLSPEKIGINYSWWISDSYDDTYAFRVSQYGAIEKEEKRYASGVRPFFVITAQGAS